jgi:hypothetical protein
VFIVWHHVWITPTEECSFDFLLPTSFRYKHSAQKHASPAHGSENAPRDCRSSPMALLGVNGSLFLISLQISLFTNLSLLRLYPRWFARQFLAPIWGCRDTINGTTLVLPLSIFCLTSLVQRCSKWTLLMPRPAFFLLPTCHSRQS